MSETADFEAIVPADKGIPIHLGDRQVWLNAETAAIWRYGEEDRHFDHLAIEIDGETTRLFDPEGALPDELIAVLDCPVIRDFQTADAETRAAYDAWTIGGIDDIEAFRRTA